MPKFEQLLAEVDSLMRESDPYGININGFWETFEKTYHYKPEPRDFGKPSLTSILDQFPNLTKVRKKHHKRKGKYAIYVCLKEEEIGNKAQGYSVHLSTSKKETSKNFNKEERSKSSTVKGNVVKASSKKLNDDVNITSVNVKRSSEPVTQRKQEKSTGETRPWTTDSSQVPVSRQEIKTAKKAHTVVKSDTAMSKDPKFVKEMEDKGFIFHTYGRDRSSSRENTEQRRKVEQPGQMGSHGQSRLPLWLSGNNGRDSSNLQSPISRNATSSRPSQQMDFTFGGYSMMPAATPMGATSPGIPLVYGMDFPSLSDVSIMLSQAGGKSAKQLQKQQVQNAQSEAFISIDAREERSSIAPPPPPRQYKEPPSATAIAADATSEASERTSKPNRSVHQHSYGRPGKNTVYVSKEELDRVAADCIDR